MLYCQMGHLILCVLGGGVDFGELCLHPLLEAAMFDGLLLEVLHLFVSLLQTSDQLPIRTFQILHVTLVFEGECLKLVEEELALCLQFPNQHILRAHQIIHVSAHQIKLVLLLSH